MIFKQERIIWHLKRQPDLPLSSPENVLSSKDIPQDDLVTPASVNTVAVAEEVPPANKNKSGADDAKIPQDCPADAQNASEVRQSEPSGSAFNRWEKLPYRLRKKRADIYISTCSEADFVEGLRNFLKSKGLSILPYDDTVHYLPSDVILLSSKERTDAGITMTLEQGKGTVWTFLKSQFGRRLE